MSVVEDHSSLARHAWRAFPHSHFAHVQSAIDQWRAFEHQKLISKTIARTIVGGNGRLIINCPPRIGKSDIVSKATPIWMLDNLPHLNLILASYGSQLADEFGRFCRNAFRTNPKLATTLRQDSKAANRWHTHVGGGMITVGVDGSVTGKGGHVILIDDPHKDWAEAKSWAARQKVIEWFNGTLYSRLEPGGSIILSMTRWDTDDLAAYMIEHHADEWDVLNLPALAMDADDPLGRDLGESVCEERYTTEQFERVARAVGEEVWMANFQQAPVQVGGGGVFNKFATENLRPVELIEGHTVDISLDFNINPGMHATIGQTFKLDDEYTTCHEVFGPRMDIEECAKAVCELIKDKGGVERFGSFDVFADATGRAREISNNKSRIRHLREALAAHGLTDFRIRVGSQNPRVADSIVAVNDVLCDVEGKRRWFINPRCKGLVRDLKTMKRDEFGGLDKSDKDVSHFADGERYRFAKVRPMTRFATETGRFGV